jgi:hypothetical protein
VCLDDGKGWWQLDGEVRVVADAVEVECGYLESGGVFLDYRENGWVDGCGYDNKGVGCEDFILSDEGFERLCIEVREKASL